MTRTMPVWDAGKILDNYTEVALASNTDKTQLITVPARSWWFLYGGKIHNGDDVARAASIKLYNENDKLLMTIVYDAALGPAGVDTFGGSGYPIPMNPGWYLSYYWTAGGISAGGTAQITAIAREIVA